MTYDELVEQLSLELQQVFLQVISRITNEALLVELIEKIKAGDPEAVFLILGMSKSSLRPIILQIENIYEQGGNFASAEYPKYLDTPQGRIVFYFDARNQRGENWLKYKSSELITNITEDTRVNVRNIVTEGLAQGRNPRSTALDIVGRINPLTNKREGGVVGLTTGQEIWVRNFRSRLENLDDKYFDAELRDKRFDKTVQAAIDSGRPLPREAVDNLVGKYRNSVLRHRAEVISRTETLEALSKSDYESIEQLIETGAIKRAAVQLEWDDVGDRRTRNEHRAMRGQTVPIGQPFITPSGVKMMHPHDRSLGATGKDVVNCRCRTKKVIQYGLGVK